MDALIKWLSADYPINQMVFTNALFALVPVSLWTWRRGLSRSTHAWLHLHVLRGCCGMSAAFLGFYAFSVLGALVVRASGLFILYRETTLGRRPTASLHPSATPWGEPDARAA